MELTSNKEGKHYILGIPSAKKSQLFSQVSFVNSEIEDETPEIKANSFASKEMAELAREKLRSFYGINLEIYEVNVKRID